METNRTCAPEILFLPSSVTGSLPSCLRVAGTDCSFVKGAGPRTGHTCEQVHSCFLGPHRASLLPAHPASPSGHYPRLFPEPPHTSPYTPRPSESGYGRARESSKSPMKSGSVLGAFQFLFFSLKAKRLCHQITVSLIYHFIPNTRHSIWHILETMCLMDK